MSRRISVSDHQKSQFLQLPMMFYKNEQYKDMSESAKTAYALLKNRFGLSIKNNWVDKHGHIYFIYKNKDLADVLNCCEKTAIKVKNELIKKGLLEQKRVGMNQPNRLYLLADNEHDTSRRVSESLYQNSQFLRIPQVFYHNEKYKSMSEDAKTAYALLQNRFEISLKNGWTDQNGHIYFYFTVNELMSVLNCASEKAVKVKQELIKLGLLEQQQVGFNQANKLYLLEPETLGAQGTVNIEIQELYKSKSRNCTNRNTGTVQIETLELYKSKTSNTDLNNTDFSYININQSEGIAQIEKSTLPKSIKQTLIKNIDRLMHDQINVNDLEEHWLANEVVITAHQYADACGYALTQTKGKIKNIKARMTRAVQDKLKIIAEMATPKQANRPREDKLPQWFKHEDQEQTQSEKKETVTQKSFAQLMAERAASKRLANA